MYWGQQSYDKWKGKFRSNWPKWPIKVDHLKSILEYSGRIKPKWSVPFDVPWTEIAGILGWMEGAKSLSCQGRPYQISVIGETVNFVKIDKVNKPESVIIDWL